MQKSLTCPNCHTEIDIEKVIFDQITAQQDVEIQKRKQEVENNFLQQEQLLKERELELNSKIQSQDEEIAKLVKERESTLRAKIEAEIKDDLKVEIEETSKRLAEQRIELDNVKKRELDLLKQKDQLEQAQKDMELVLQRKLSEQKSELEERVRKQEQEANYLRMQQKDELINNLNLQMTEMKRKMEQGSMQSQGEILELEIERLLAGQFPFDIISEVPKGVAGADIIQEVKNPFQQSCGKIVYETKRTKSFSPSWIDKLKSDQRALNAEVSVLVTEVLPKGMDKFGLLNGVWVCKFEEVAALSLVLREGLLQIYDVKLSGENRSDKMAMLYDYLTSKEFGNQFQAVVDGFVGQKALLEREKRSLQSIWKEREKQIELSAQAAISMYGNIKAIAGSAIQTINELELPEEMQSDDKNTKLIS
jgi:hypothetical protein